MLQEYIAVGIALRQLTAQEAVLLFSINILYQSLFGLEIKCHRVTFIAVLSHLELWCTFQFPQYSVFNSTSCMHYIVVEIYIDFLAFQIHLFVFHARIAIKIRRPRLSIVDHRVVRGIFYWCL